MKVHDTFWVHESALSTVYEFLKVHFQQASWVYEIAVKKTTHKFMEMDCQQTAHKFMEDLCMCSCDLC